MRYIDADLLEPDTEWDDYKDGYMSYSDLQIRCAKTADVRENVKGNWIRFKNIAECSNCKTVWHDNLGLTKRWSFCPICGADMRGER